MSECDCRCYLIPGNIREYPIILYIIAPQQIIREAKNVTDRLTSSALKMIVLYRFRWVAPPPGDLILLTYNSKTVGIIL
jgi:hypothetical protein